VCSANEGYNSWVPRGKNLRDRSGKKPGGPPCQDSASQDQCLADRGHCNQFTEAGSEMERVCPGTCDSCDRCRCQDSAQWHKYCPYWAGYCSSLGVLGEWMITNCRKTCGKCKCKCCSYQGKSHKLGEIIPLPEKCGELVCEEGLIAESSPLLAGAVAHNVSHPDELTLVFRSVHAGADCCVLDNNTMVEEGWSGEVDLNGSSIPGICCRGVLSTPIKTPRTIVKGVLMYEESGYKYYKVPVAHGTRMNVGVVTETCEAHGMKSVCLQAGCKHNSDGCRVTPLSIQCANPMIGLSIKICDGKTPRSCPSMDGMFPDHKGTYYGQGACGTLSGKWCAAGRDAVSSEAKQLYAYCVL